MTASRHGAREGIAFRFPAHVEGSPLVDRVRAPHALDAGLTSIGRVAIPSTPQSSMTVKGMVFRPGSA
ncbi:MAG TPA: hypothetical protein PKX48_13410 [Planctomycetota bacterium]|jgi:hypothetical protein|nr:hypothetical protein [Planctomycetota bacterium]NMD35368.1 hypothetical protein [Planctomycetota bacterium]HNS00027.1 hypothetical protein [Planctomycetota bacterium]HNU27049.1 hypothetical protein [Planctomycetota bacterium]HOE29614.1 hypothetical protein [Planctomycetota bacterium]